MEGHWYPDNPERGQGYRALLCAERVDTLLAEALWKAGIGKFYFYYFLLQVADISRIEELIKRVSGLSIYF